MQDLPAPWQLIALIAAGALAGFVNVVAGGGSLLTLPLLIFLGLPETTANGTSRLAILVQSVSACWTFARDERIDYGLLLTLLRPALLGAGAGALLAARLPDAGFRALLGWVMLGCAALVVAAPGAGRDGGKPLRLAPRLLWPCLLAVGFYGGLIQAGVGYLILASLTLVLGIELVQANIAKNALIACYTPLALVLFVAHGQVDWLLGLVLSAGQALGGWLGATTTLVRGARFVRAVLALVVLASGIALLVR